MMIKQKNMSYPTANIALLNADKRSYEISIDTARNITDLNNWEKLVIEPFTEEPQSMHTVKPSADNAGFRLDIGQMAKVTVLYNYGKYSVSRSGNDIIDITVEDTVADSIAIVITIRRQGE